MPAHRFTTLLCAALFGIFQTSQPSTPNSHPGTQNTNQTKTNTDRSATSADQTKPNNTPTKASTASTSDVTAEPNPLIAGQTVTFYWPADASKVIISGGGLGDHLRVMGQDSITDVPQKPTTYTFDLYFPPDSKDQSGASSHPTGHVQEQVRVDFYPGTFPKLATYHDPHHWKIDVLSGWNRYPFPEADPANNALIYFEPEEDSVERTSVTIMPVKKDMSSYALMQKAMAEAPTEYDVIKDVTQKLTTHCGVPATWLDFTGLDRAQPDVPLKAMALSFVRDGKGYVISGRTRASDFDKRGKLLRSLVRSFALEPAVQTSRENSPKAPPRLSHKSKRKSQS